MNQPHLKSKTCTYYTSSTLYRYANVNFRNGIVCIVFVKVRYTFLIFEPKRDEVTGEWNKLHNEELHILYSSPNIIGQIKSRRMTWAGHVARMGSRGKFTWFWWESPNERDHLEDQGADGRMGSEWILWRLAGGGRVEWIRLAQDRGRWRVLVNMVTNLRVLAPRSLFGTRFYEHSQCAGAKNVCGNWFG
jgi:hypothetical protein